MRRRLTNVVGWKGRRVPGHRVIPPHLKLGILTRGRIVLPTETVDDWLVDVAVAGGAEWPYRLRRKLPEIVPEVPVTVELFSNQRPEMTDLDIYDAFTSYLTLRRQRYFPDRLLLWQPMPHVDRKRLEHRLDLDISRLFELARVSGQPRQPRRFLLLAYASLPEARLSEFIAPASPAPPTPASQMPPLEGMTSPSTGYSLRLAPDEDDPSNILGTQVGAVVPVLVHGKHEDDEYIWLDIELTADLEVEQNGTRGKLPAKTRCWIVGQEKKSPPILEKLVLNKGPWLEDAGLQYVAAPWGFFRSQLRSFETDNSALGLGDRITKLRQTGHRKDLPFDFVIGAPQGSVYLDSLPSDGTRWQLMRDYQAVRAPDGRIVDVFHVLVALDVLRRLEQKHVIFLAIDIGSNWAAATWAGDLGAGAADLDRHAAGGWETLHKGVDFAARADYYFDSRAGDRDLIADVDGWGIHALRGRVELDSIDALLASYYEHTVVEGTRTVTSARRDAVERFLAHYGFHYDATTDYGRYPFLGTQRAKSVVRSEIERFAHVWAVGHHRKQPVDRAAVDAMADAFLYWLEIQTIENGATVP